MKKSLKNHFGGNLNKFVFCYNSTTGTPGTGIDITFGPLVNICKTTKEGKFI